MPCFCQIYWLSQVFFFCLNTFEYQKLDKHLQAGLPARLLLNLILYNCLNLSCFNQGKQKSLDFSENYFFFRWTRDRNKAVSYCSDPGGKYGTGRSCIMGLPITDLTQKTNQSIVQIRRYKSVTRIMNASKYLKSPYNLKSGLVHYMDNAMFKLLNFAR